MSVILGIDPGTRVTGFALLKDTGDGLKCLQFGTIDLQRETSFARRLKVLAEKIEALITPEVHSVVVEKIFLGKNADSAFKLGHARGVCMAVAAKAGCEVFEYAARQVKKTLTGHGGADKKQVQMWVREELALPRSPMPLDASDALALAVCHARLQSVRERFAAIDL